MIHPVHVQMMAFYICIYILYYLIIYSYIKYNIYVERLSRLYNNVQVRAARARYNNVDTINTNI